MKLYTEEQVNLAMRLIFDDRGTFKQVLNQLKPIELPSDEDLEKAQKEQRLTMEEMCRFEEGVEWMIKQINNQK